MAAPLAGLISETKIKLNKTGNKNNNNKFERYSEKKINQKLFHPSLIKLSFGTDCLTSCCFALNPEIHPYRGIHSMCLLL
jgi:hypothetical protein